MNLVANSAVLRAIGIAMIVIAVLNVIPYGVFLAGGGQQLVANEAVEPTSGNIVNDILLAVGSFTSPMGIMTLIHAPVLAAVGVALLLNKRWEMFAAIMIGLDILVKIGVILSLASIGRNAAILVPLAFIVVEVVLLAAALREWNARRRATGLTREPAT
jgi:hypothetical protein